MGGRAVLGTLVSWLSTCSARKMAPSSPAPFFLAWLQWIFLLFSFCACSHSFSLPKLSEQLSNAKASISPTTCSFSVVSASCGRGRRESWARGLNFNSMGALPAKKHSLLDNSSLETILSRESQGRRDSRGSICLLGNWLDLQGRSILHFHSLIYLLPHSLTLLLVFMRHPQAGQHTLFWRHFSMAEMGLISVRHSQSLCNAPLSPVTNPPLPPLFWW